MLGIADLSRAVLRGADLSRADLGNTDLRGADLRSTTLRGADLAGADLRNADLTRADLRDADYIRNADLTGVCHDDRTTWPTGFTPPSSRSESCLPAVEWRAVFRDARD
jgi:uncharacterized protein YjbI with pentapeptide repeats